MKVPVVITATAFALADLHQAWAGDTQTPVLIAPHQTSDSQDHNWTGFYMGVGGGYAGANVNSDGSATESRDGNSDEAGQPSR